jgi:hypothetical protein
VWARRAMHLARRSPMLRGVRRGVGARTGDADAAEELAQAYGAVAKVPGARVVVDSSKSVGVASLLGLAPGIEGHVVHLVLDPRAVVHSWHRRGHPTGRAVRTWNVVNGAGEIVRRWPGSGRSVQLRYEDFVRDPGGSLRRIAHVVGEAGQTMPLDGPSRLRLGPNHTLAGNDRVRFGTGSIELREDDRWRTEMQPGTRRAVTAGTLPLLLRYRYSLGDGRPAS